VPNVRPAKADRRFRDLPTLRPSSASRPLQALGASQILSGRTARQSQALSRGPAHRGLTRGLIVVSLISAAAICGAITLADDPDQATPIAAIGSNLRHARATLEGFGSRLIAAPGASLGTWAARFGDTRNDSKKRVPGAVLGVSITDRLRNSEALSSALARHGVGPDDVSLLVNALKGTLDVRSLRKGSAFRIEQQGSRDEPGVRMDAFEFTTMNGQGAPRLIRATRDPRPDARGFVVSVTDAPVEKRLEPMGGEVRTSLYDAIIAMGGDGNLVNRFVDVFAWDVDFYRQTQKGDQFRVLVEKSYAGGRFLGYGKVVAAEYVNAGAVFRGFSFESKDGKVTGTFNDEGEAMEKTFLKSPLEIARVTSSYGQRFHPILQTQKQHEGIDYGAPQGTPFWVVADGVVTDARFAGSAGNMIVVKHMNGYETEYFHLSRFAEGVRPGARVKQHQIIGYVGTTGRSTGPHLHFGMRKGGGHVDPARQSFPSAHPVPAPYKKEFDAFVAPLLAELRALDMA
jgi:murein DD-endopeptidase MepM/ murein hydrolase activator NlpD